MQACPPGVYNLVWHMDKGTLPWCLHQVLWEHHGGISGIAEIREASEGRWHWSWVLKDGEEFVGWLNFDPRIGTSTFLKDNEVRDWNGMLGNICQDCPIPASLLLHTVPESSTQPYPQLPAQRHWPANLFHPDTFLTQKCGGRLV